MDARRVGFEVTLVSDACRGVDFPAGSVQKALDSMQRAGVRVAASRSVPADR